MSEYVKVRLLATITGIVGDYEIGEEWELPPEMAANLVRNGYAAYVTATADDGPQTATLAPAERTTAGPQRRSRGGGTL